MSNEFHVPTEVLHVTNTLQNAGFEAYLVGGCVRDVLLNKSPNDWDVTTNAHPEQIQGLFAETFYNNNFGTVGIVNESAQDERLRVIEVTPYRTDGEYSNKRHPDTVTFGVTLEDDLARRDFTVNAIALDVLNGHVVDPYHGRIDLGARMLRAVGDPSARFAEDALRMMRAIRLGAELGFGIEQNTFSAIVAHGALLSHVSKERIRDEFVKIIMSQRPREALLHMKHTGLLVYAVPELEHGFGVSQNHAHKYDVFEHLLHSVQHASDKNFPLHIRLAALFHDISKPECKRVSKNDGVTFYGHEVVGSRVTRAALNSLRLPREIIDLVSNLVRWHMFFSDPDIITLSAVRRMIANVGRQHIWDLIDVRICDRIGSGRPKEQPFRLRAYKSMIEQALRDPVSVAMLALSGKELMDVTHETPGPRIGNILHTLLDEVLDDPGKNTAEYLSQRALELSGLDDHELLVLGKGGREKRDKEDERICAEIRKKHGV